MHLRALALLTLCALLSACAQSQRSTQRSLPEVSPATISYATSDGGEISANEYGAGPRAVVLAHGGRFDKKSWDAQAQSLAREGFRVLAIDFRGYGASTRGSADDDLGYALDVLGAVRYLRETGAQEVGVVGASFGGWAAARASVLSPVGAIDSLVLLASSPIERPDRLKGRKLFIIAEDDPNFDGTLRIDRFRAMYERAPQPKMFVTVPGEAHAQFLFESEQGERVMEEIVRFLREH